jgi:hypothetical protein
MNEAEISDASALCPLQDAGGGIGGRIMPERQRLTRQSEGKARKFLAGQFIFGLLVLCLLVFHAVAVAAGAERAVIYYSPG